MKYFKSLQEALEFTRTNHYNEPVDAETQAMGDEAYDALKKCVEKAEKNPKFIIFCGKSINLKEIKEYTITETRELDISADKTPTWKNGYGLDILFYGEKYYHSIGCVDYEKAEKMKEKLDNILGAVNLEKGD